MRHGRRQLDDSFDLRQNDLADRVARDPVEGAHAILRFVVASKAFFNFARIGSNQSR
jgi:hypothetical protein